MPERPLPQRDLAGRLASYETLFDISRMLLVSVTQDELFERISSELNRLVPVDALTIYRVDEVASQIVPVHARDQWADEIMAAPLALGEGLTGWVVEHREPANITAAERDPRIAVVPGTPEDEPEAIISVPLVVHDHPIGALNTYRLGEGVEFSADEFVLVQQFAAVAALALENTQNRTRLLHEAQTDWLTGLHNHRVFHERLHDELERAERYGRPVSLMAFDLDDFKLLNDVHGHQEGDLVLRRVAAAAREELRGSDLACRVGGEEFAIILPEAGKRAARAAADRLCARVRALPGARAVTVSCGVASYPADAADATELVAGADAALYAAKERGKDRAASFSAAVLAHRARRATRANGEESLASLRLLGAVADVLPGIAAAAETSPQAVAARIAEAVVQAMGADAAIVLGAGPGGRERVLAARGIRNARSVALAAALAPPADPTGLDVVRSNELPAVSADAAARHVHVVTAPLDEGRLAVVCAEPARAVLDAIAALAAQGGLALGHARLLAGRRKGETGERRGLRSAGG
ncbi:MAG TPA: sensor domain-containing diguanylate cyclase [Gaiellales bacterium]|nr:sensor domain-containing diguanylate cyclase [Gaiellales bacterium]